MISAPAQFGARLREIVLDAVFPPRCAGCGAWSKALFCAGCAPQLKPIAPPQCATCGLPFDPLAQAAEECADCRANRYHGAPPFELLRSAYEFDGPLREAIHRFKYADKTALATPLSALLHEFLTRQSTLVPSIPLADLSLLAPVPLHAWRRYRRGYNQSALLARELGRRLGIGAAEVLWRTRHTAPQVELSARERAQNVRGAFEIDAIALARHNPSRGAVLLLDDVCTTGATLRECAAVLKAAGVPRVYALTLARQL